MEIRSIIYNGEEIDFVVSIDRECIERNEEDFLEDTIILNDTIKEIEENGGFNGKY